MGRYWAHDVPAWLTEVGVRWRGWPGHETRSRSSGGFEGDAPRGLVWHHTAGSGSWSTDYVARYCAERATVDGRRVTPVGNAVGGRDGEIVIIAAGAANTQGKGGPVTTSAGLVPLDDGNRRLYAVEFHNNGIGQEWPQEQIEAGVRAFAVMARKWRMDPMTDVLLHHTWCLPSCPGRKIDAAGPTPSHPQLGGLAGARTWNVVELRKVVAAEIARQEAPVTPVARTLSLGMSGPDVYALIDLLMRSRAYPAQWAGDRNDGVFGPHTYAGVANVQTFLRLPVTGVWGEPEATSWLAWLQLVEALGAPQPEAA